MTLLLWLIQLGPVQYIESEAKSFFGHNFFEILLTIIYRISEFTDKHCVIEIRCGLECNSKYPARTF